MILLEAFDSKILELDEVINVEQSCEQEKQILVIVGREVYDCKSGKKELRE